MTLSQELTELADGFRKRFNKTDKLSIQDMIKLVTPPKYPCLVDEGKIIFTRGYNVNDRTANDGATITDDCFIVPEVYDNFAVLQKAHQKGNVKLRTHFKLVSGTGVVAWCLDGQNTAAKWFTSTPTSDLIIPGDFNYSGHDQSN